MSRQSQYVKDWRQNTKKRMLYAMGSCCQLCGYNKCPDALEFHHIDPHSKKFSFGSVRANIKGWKILVEELRKCILVCSNCHKEIHAKIHDDQMLKSSFNEDWVEYKDKDDCDLPNSRTGNGIQIHKCHIRM
jgi:hypothetical protein